MRDELIAVFDTDVYLEVDNNNLTELYPLSASLGTRGLANGASFGIRHRF